MRKTMTFILTVLAASALLLTGCNPILPSGGKSVKFTANSKSQPATKTTYAGNAASTGSTHEDIYWSPNDAIRIYSGDPSVVRPVIQTENGVCADYKLVVPNATSTRASLENEASNGLEWLDDPTGTAVTFYAVYPRSTRGSESGWFTMSIPSEQKFATPTGTNMEHAYMLAQNTLTRSQFNTAVSLDFYPAFTAFQINLTSKDDELTLMKFRIYSEDNHLAGDYYGKLIAVNGQSEKDKYFAFNNGQTLRMDFACVLDDNNQPTSLQNEVSVEFPFVEDASTGARTYTEKISRNKAVDFTLLALPYGIVNPLADYSSQPYLTNLWLEVTYLRNGVREQKRLALKQTTNGVESFIEFSACKKYRLNALAVGDSWKIFFGVSVDDWKELDPTTIVF